PAGVPPPPRRVAHLGPPRALGGFDPPHLPHHSHRGLRSRPPRRPPAGGEPPRFVRPGPGIRPVPPARAVPVPPLHPPPPGRRRRLGHRARAVGRRRRRAGDERPSEQRAGVSRRGRHGRGARLRPAPGPGRRRLVPVPPGIGRGRHEHRPPPPHTVSYAGLPRAEGTAPPGGNCRGNAHFVRRAHPGPGAAHHRGLHER